ncbi:hypothetical protein G4B88_017053 [Cannabis sativa]|uniref:Uncharacterized protein n=1 Tax=Cannabis sativa TaxID=3483 RepID=A0A7J6H0A2_CANSA|nr:hypothetical protein G4B88_017053 [Cannabis sativa]
MASPLPLAASTNSEVNLKTIFRPGRFRDALNNQRMARSVGYDIIIDMIQLFYFSSFQSEAKKKKGRKKIEVANLKSNY